MATASGCCRKILLGTSSPIMRRRGIITIMEKNSPRTAPNIEMNIDVTTAVFVTTQMLVPVKVVERNHSGLFRSFRTVCADRDPDFALLRILFISEATSAISPPENRPCRNRTMTMKAYVTRLSTTLFLFPLQSDLHDSRFAHLFHLNGKDIKIYGVPSGRKLPETKPPTVSNSSSETDVPTSSLNSSTSIAPDSMYDPSFIF